MKESDAAGIGWLEHPASLAPGAWSAPPYITGTFKRDAQKAAPQFLAIQRSNRSARLVSFHIHKTEATTLPRKHILRQLDRTHFSMRSE